MIVDLHSHIIPGMDDGSASMEESLSMAQIALSEGISAIVATSHCTNPKDIDGFLEERDTKLEKLLTQLKQNGVNVSILKGAEVYIDMEFFKAQCLHKLTINNTRYMLVELPMITFPLYTEEFLYKLQLLGFIPIIAHPERNERIMKNPELLYHLADLGSLVQINTGSITGLFGHLAQKCARAILNRKMAHLVATDAHSDGKRKPAIRDCIKTLNNWLGQERTKRLVYEAPAAIVANGFIDL